MHMSMRRKVRGFWHQFASKHSSWTRWDSFEDGICQYVRYGAVLPTTQLSPLVYGLKLLLANVQAGEGDDCREVLLTPSVSKVPQECFDGEHMVLVSST
jgi:hypothetical protein